jgi:hypothetical protein
MKLLLQCAVVVVLAGLGFAQIPSGEQQAVTSARLVVPAVAPANPLPQQGTAAGSRFMSPSAKTVDFGSSLMPMAGGADVRTRKRLWYGLMVAEHGAAFFDAWSTRQVLSQGGRELDPLVRPFAHSEALYPALQVSPAVADYVSLRLMHSNSRFLRRLWWVPQAVGVAGSSICGIKNMSNLR